MLLLAAVTLPARLTASTTSLLRTGNPASNVLPDEGVAFSAVKLASALVVVLRLSSQSIREFLNIFVALV